MYYDMKCTNKECANFEVIETVSCPVDDRDSQKCEKCSELLTRVYVALAIRTWGDGYKG